MFAKLGKCFHDGCSADAMVNTFDENGYRTGKFCWDHVPPSPLKNGWPQAAQENSGGQERDPPATQVAGDAEKGCTGVFSGPNGKPQFQWIGTCTCKWCGETIELEAQSLHVAEGEVRGIGWLENQNGYFFCGELCRDKQAFSDGEV